MDMATRHYTTVEDLSQEEHLLVFELAKHFQYHHQKIGTNYSHLLRGKIITCLFSHNSTRTKAVIKSAVYKLGGAFSFENIGSNSYYSDKQESIDDLLFSISQFSDAIIIRHSDIDLSKYKSLIECPVVNAMAGSEEHSLAAIGRAYSLYKRFGNISDISVGFYGSISSSRPLKALVKLLNMFGSEIYHDPVFSEASAEQYDLLGLRINEEKYVASNLNSFIDKIDGLFVAEGLLQKNKTDSFKHEYWRRFSSINLEQINRLKKNCLLSAGMPTQISDGRRTISYETQSIFYNEKKNIFMDWTYCIQALLSYLLDLHSEINEFTKTYPNKTIHPTATVATAPSASGHV